jgi:hypothetical protein
MVAAAFVAGTVVPFIMFFLVTTHTVAIYAHQRRERRAKLERRERRRRRKAVNESDDAGRVSMGFYVSPWDFHNSPERPPSPSPTITKPSRLSLRERWQSSRRLSIRNRWRDTRNVKTTDDMEAL